MNSISPQKFYVPISHIIRLCKQRCEIIVLILGFLLSLNKGICFGRGKTNLNKLIGKQYVLAMKMIPEQGLEYKELRDLGKDVIYNALKKDKLLHL